MMDPLVTVIVPVYNVEKFLAECIQSVCAQTYSHLEIILVDDGSADGSGRLCDVFAQRDGRIRVIHQANSGVSAARNAGLDAAKGDYIYFVDGDDWVSATMVEETVRFLEQQGVDICTWGHDIVYEDGAARYGGRWKPVRFQFSEEDRKRRFLCRWILPGRLDWSVWNRVFRRDVIQRTGLRFAEEQRIFEDLDFTFRYLAYCRNLYYFPKSFYRYRQRGSSAMHTITLENWMINVLGMVRRQDQALSAQKLFHPFYYYGGTVLTVLLENFTNNQPLEQDLAQAVAYLRSTDDWNYLLEQARLAVEDRTGLRRVCGWRLGEQVYGFFQYLLTGDLSAYRSANRVQDRYKALRSLKNKLLHGQGG